MRVTNQSGQSRIALAMVVVLMVLAGLAIPRFAIEGDLAKMLPAGDPYVDEIAAMAADPNGARAMLVVLRGAERLDEMVAALRASPFVARVDATREELFGALAPGAREAPLYHVPEATLRSLEERLSAGGRAAELQHLEARIAADPFAGRELAQRDPLGLRWILDAARARAVPIALATDTPYVVLKDGSRAVLRVIGKKDPFDLEFSKQLVADLESRLHGRDALLLGSYGTAVADERRIRGDLVWNGTLSTLLVAAFLALATRSLVEPLILFAPSALALFCALPLGAFLFGPLSPLAIGAAGILAGLGADCAIHWKARYDEERRHAGHATAVRATVRALLRPMNAAVLTTVVAFLSLCLGRFRGLAGFGLLLTLGLLLSVWFTFALMPWLLAWRTPRPGRPWAWSPRARWPAGLVGVAAAAAAAVLAVRGVAITTDPRALRPADDPLVLAQAEAERAIGIAAVPVVAKLDPAASDAALASGLEALVAQGRIRFAQWSPGPERQERVARFAERTRGWVDSTLSDLAGLGYEPDAFRAGLEAFARLFSAPAPKAPQQRRALLFLPHAIHELRGWEALRTAVHEQLGAKTELLAALGVLARLRAVLVHDLWLASLVATAAVAALTFALAASWRAALTSLLGLVLGALITLGCVSALGIELQLGNFVALPFVLGIGVDYGIYVVERMANGEDLTEAFVAVWRASITTLLGFGSLVVAKTPGLASLGTVTAIGVAACLAVSVFVLPRFRAFVAGRPRA